MATEMNLGTLVVHLTARANEFNRVLKTAEARIDATAKKIGSIGKRLSLMVTLPIVGIGAAMTKLASDAEEIDSKFRVTFSSVADSATAAMKELDDAYLMNSTQAKELLSNTGDLLTGFGFTQDMALDLSIQTQKLAADLASFTNIQGGAQRASMAITKALLGERESVKLLGISILEEDVKQQVLINTMNGLNFSTLRQAKAYATLQLAQKQSKNAIGDVARTSESLANQWRDMTADVRALGEDFGKILIPVAKEGVAVFKNLLSMFKGMDKSTKEAIIKYAALAAAVGPVLWITSHLVGAFGKLIGLSRTLIMLVPNVFKSLITHTYALNAALILIPAVLVSWLEMFGLIDIGFTKLLGSIRVGTWQLGTLFGATAANVLIAWEKVKAGLEITWESIKMSFNVALKTMYGYVLKIGDAISGAFWTLAQKVVDSFETLLSPLKESLLNMIKLAAELRVMSVEAAGKLHAEVSIAFAAPGRFVDAQKKKAEEFYGGLISANKKASDKIVADWETTTAKIVSGTDKNISKLKTAIQDIFKKDIEDQAAGVNQFGSVFQDLIEKAKTFLGITKAVEAETEEIGREWWNAFHKMDMATAGLGKAKNETKEINKYTKYVKQMWRDIGDTVGNAFEDALFEAKKLRDVVKNLSRDLARAVFRSAVTKPLADAIAGNVKASAQGNVFTNGRIHKFATGAVFNSPTYFPMSDKSTGVVGEAGPEAALPLTRLGDGDLGVKTDGIGNRPINIYVQGVKDADSFKASQNQITRAVAGNIGRKT